MTSTPVFTEPNEAYEWYRDQIADTVAHLDNEEDKYDFLDLLVVELENMIWQMEGDE